MTSTASSVETAPPARRPGGWHHTDEIIPLLNKKFYADAANSQMYLDTARLRSLDFTLKDVTAFLETIDIFVAAFTERRSQRRASPASMIKPVPNWRSVNWNCE